MHDLQFSPYLAHAARHGRPVHPRRPAPRRRSGARVAAMTLVALLAALGFGVGAARAAGTRRTRDLTVTATDFRLATPGQVAAGPTRVRLVNHGSEGHQAALVRLGAGHTSGEFLGALATSFGASRRFGTFVGGPNAAAPGRTSEATVTLKAGHYLAVCLMPSASDGTPHVMKGMLTEFDVTGTAKARPQPKVPTIETTEFHFRFPRAARRALANGRPVAVRNTGSQIHEVVVARMQRGETVSDVAHWADHPLGTPASGPMPHDELAGVTELAPGASARMQAHLTKGRYALLCFLPDDDRAGTSHLHEGMAYPFTVR